MISMMRRSTLIAIASIGIGVVVLMVIYRYRLMERFRTVDYPHHQENQIPLESNPNREPDLVVGDPSPEPVPTTSPTTGELRSSDQPTDQERWNGFDGGCDEFMMLGGSC